jgi:hypothetical protein
MWWYVEIIQGYTGNVDNSTAERVEQFKYLGKNLTYQNLIQEKLRVI